MCGYVCVCAWGGGGLFLTEARQIKLEIVVSHENVSFPLKGMATLMKNISEI